MKQADTLRLALKYLEHPDVQSMPFALPAAAAAERVREAIADSSKSQTLTQLEFEENDFEAAERIARKLGYKQTAYTSTSALWGLFCLPENPQYSKGPTSGGCIVKTRELGFLFVQDTEDLHVE